MPKTSQQPVRPPSSDGPWTPCSAAAVDAAADGDPQVRAILEHAAEGIVTIGEDGRVRVFNPAAERLFGYTADEIVGRNIKVLMDDADRLAHDGYIHAYMATGEGKILGLGPREVTARRKDGSVFPIELNISKFFLGSERLFIGTMRDITRRKVAEQALRESEAKLRTQVLELMDREERLEAQGADLVALAEDTALVRDELDTLNREKDKFFTIIAHDLKSPFNALLGFSSLLATQAEALDKDQVAEYGRLVHQAGQQAYNLLEDLLDWSRLQMGRVTFEPQPLDLGNAIQANLFLFEPIAAAKKIRMTSDHLPGLMVSADKQMFDTILRNLINNAIKFTPDDGTIAIAARPRGDLAEVTVADGGVGIPADKLPRLFRLEEKTSTKETKGETGTGLGLHLCKELVEKHGGELTVESVVGEGSTFRLTLPAAG